MWVKRQCSACGVVKGIASYTKRGEGGKRRKVCRMCTREQRKNYSRTLPGYLTDRWRDLNNRTVNGSHPGWSNPKAQKYLSTGVRLEMTREQLKGFIEQHWHTISSLIEQGAKPVIDRIDASGHYELDNIRILSTAQNIRRMHGYEPETDDAERYGYDPEAA
jgi:hypothetical protein